MPRRSSGTLFHRRIGGVREVLLVHPGGPFWRGKDVGAWQIPKGEPEPGEDLEAAARREAGEELGGAVTVPLVPLGKVRQAGGKLVTAFEAEQDIAVAAIVSATIEIVWPSHCGRRLTIPKGDQARWFTLVEAGRIKLPSQLPLIDRLESGGNSPVAASA